MTQFCQDLGLPAPSLSVVFFIGQRRLERILLGRFDIPRILGERKRPAAELFHPQDIPWHVLVTTRESFRGRGRKLDGGTATQQCKVCKQVFRLRCALSESCHSLEVRWRGDVVARYDQLELKVVEDFDDE